MIQFDNHNIIKRINYDGHDIQKVYGCDGHLVWEFDSSGYTPLDYIKTNNANSSGVRLLSKPDNTTVIELDCEVIYAEGSASIMDCCNLSFNIRASSPNYNYCTLSYGGALIDLKTCPSFKTRHVWKIGRVSGTTDTTKVGWSCEDTTRTDTKETLTFNGAGNILVGGIRYNDCNYIHPTSGDSSNYVQCRIYSVKVYDNYGSNLIGNYIPVQRYDGADTLYDTVTGQFATPYGLVNTDL